MSEERIVKEEIVYNDEGKPQSLVHAIIDGKLYLNSVEVYEWQLTPEELKTYFPERFLQLHDKWDCPVEGCTFRDGEGMAGLRMHFVNKANRTNPEVFDAKHGEWWDEHKHLFAKGASREQALTALREMKEMQHAAR